jgi:hypothetical protein
MTTIRKPQPKRKPAVKEIRPAMLFYGRDYFTDINVITMTAEQECSYLRGIWWCWQEKYLPDDMRKLAAICGKNMSVETFEQQVWPALKPCFTLVQNPDGESGSVWIHKKVESIREEINKFSSKRAEAGKVGAEVRWQTHGKSDGKPMANGMAKTWPSSSSSSSSSSASVSAKENTKTLCSSDDERCADPLLLESPKEKPVDEVKVWFDSEFWPAYPRKVAKPQALRAARRHGKTAADRAAIMDCLRRRLPALQAQYRTDGDFRPYPASWLNKTPWIDPEETATPAVSTKPDALDSAIDEAMRRLMNGKD